MKSKLCFLNILLILVIVLVTACSKTTQETATETQPSTSTTTTTTSNGATTSTTGPSHGGTLVYGGETDWGSLDPHTGSGSTHTILLSIFEGLMERDLTAPNTGAAPDIVPALAKNWEVSDDGLVYTFYLRENVKFHDGTPFNAEAVEFNVKRVWDETFTYYYSQAAGIGTDCFEKLDEVQVVDDLTVKFIMKEHSALFLTRLQEPTGIGLPLFVSPDSVRKWGNEEVTNHPVGTGPFKFVERGTGGEIVLERNADYWNKPYPYLDEIIFVPLPETVTRVNALVANEVDLIPAVPADKIQTLKDAGFNISQGATPHIWYFIINMEEEPLQDVRVRQAINMAIDKEGLARELLSNSALPAISLMSRTSPSYDVNWTDPYSYNPTKAKELLEEAGYGDGFETTITTSTAGTGQLFPVEMAQWIQRNLAAVNIKVNIQTYEWNTYIGVFLKGAQPGIGLMQMSWGMSSDTWLNLLMRSTSWYNTGHLVDLEIDTLLDQMYAAKSEQERIGYAQQIHLLERQNAYFVPIVNDAMPYALSSKVKGFVRAPEWQVTLKNVWLEQ